MSDSPPLNRICDGIKPAPLRRFTAWRTAMFRGARSSLRVGRTPAWVLLMRLARQTLCTALVKLSRYTRAWACVTAVPQLELYRFP